MCLAWRVKTHPRRFQASVKRSEMRNGCLANADDPNFIGLDQSNVILVLEQFGKRDGCHPACGAATDDDDVANR